MGALEIVEEARAKGIRFTLVSHRRVRIEGPTELVAYFKNALKGQHGNVVALLEEHSIEAPDTGLTAKLSLFLRQQRRLQREHQQRQQKQPQLPKPASAPQTAENFVAGFESKLTPFAFQVLQAVAQHADETGTARIPYATICRTLNISTFEYNLVGQALHACEAVGALLVTRKRGRNPNVYQLALQPKPGTAELVKHLTHIFRTTFVDFEGFVTFSQDQLVKLTGATKVEIRFALRTMEANGLIESQPRPGYSNAYRLKQERVTSL